MVAVKFIAGLDGSLSVKVATSPDQGWLIFGAMASTDTPVIDGGVTVAESSTATLMPPLVYVGPDGP
jgi:hypothetical protein